MLLDFDVLIVTMCHLERKEDVSRFMRTCQTLHAAGIPILLSDGVYLDEKRQITSFYNFMSTGNGRRYQHLTTLTISLYEWQEHQTKRMIWRLLYRSRALEKLEISNPKFTDEYLRCGDAISMLPNLKELTMSWDDPSELQGMFAKMVSKLTKVRLVFYPADIWIDPIQGATEPRWREPVQEDLGPRWINPVELLEKFTSSLEQLDVAPAGFTVTDIPYINMKHLRIEWLGYPTLPPLVLAYPNLRTLITRCPHSDFSDVDVNEVRQYNQSFQQQTSWATLDYVSASANELHLLAICCKIRYLDLNCLETEEEAQMLTTVLPDCHPSILHIPFGDINMELFPTIVQSIHSDLLHLILSVNLEPYSSVQAVRVLDRLLESLHPLSISKLQLDLRWTTSGFKRLWRFPDENTKPVSAELFLTVFDPEALACRIVSSVPSLKYLSLEVNHGDRAKTYWQVEEEEGCRTSKELDCQLGEKLLFESEIEHPFR